MTVASGRRQVSFGLVTLALAMAAAALAGCTVAPSRIAVRLVDDDLTFSVCQRASANRIEVSIVPDSGSEDDIILIWSATGAAGRHDEVTFSSDRLPGQSVLDAPPGDITLPGHQLLLHYDIDRNGVAESGLFASWDGDDVSEEYWLDSNGKHHADWCQQ